ncbi:FKBP-type peptidyl-prolyl cis-trans isomerase [Pontivivens insulae]|uniref:Peptidyl-prolyl cis-trans isomerase n=1 Tax=Pontivivens insulae TaxID=1639689 RepID=A0A2R8A9S4_9RHOB|nr:peptidylprolyl isomerase [Pontivivens insulae]RED12875.1 FKBP-type peptidyl-prolyl cis-trans isomerase 2 [Pontivivens insulae]SPF28966.1 FKBP-type peptidyl-prolyl cis-trans isomerase SlyD [Pontivivens insulae]
MSDEKAAPGDKIALHYTGKLEDGKQFDSSVGKDPVKFTLGKGEVVPGLDKRLAGRAVGDRDTVTLTAEEGFGEFDSNKITIVDRDQLPGDGPLEQGQKIRGRRPNGKFVIFTVLNDADGKVVLDGNHPLAGKNLTYEWEIVDLNKSQE